MRYIMISRFGTSQEMVIQPIEEEKIALHLAIDSRGLYLTEEKYFTKNIADPNRNSNRALMKERIKALGLNYDELFESNKHLIVNVAAENVKKVNPLKASKRSMKK